MTNDKLVGHACQTGEGGAAQFVICYLLFVICYLLFVPAAAGSSERASGEFGCGHALVTKAVCSSRFRFFSMNPETKIQISESTYMAAPIISMETISGVGARKIESQNISTKA